jgi:polynucleotide 5'-hydroxyl-kinase GRC3/NOL9
VGGDRTVQLLEDRIPAAWPSSLAEVTSASVVLVIGAAEAGKTTFTTWLANHLRAHGERVGIVDADVGQSEIGPPTTVGLGAVERPLTRIGDADVVAIEFVGVTSPGKRPWQVAEATGRLVHAARARFTRVIVDTSGFVSGGFAAAVKQRKVAAADPDVVVAIQVADECEHILRGLDARARPRVVRLPAVRGTRPRSAADRRRHRQGALVRYFEKARAVTLDTKRVSVRTVTGDAVDVAAILPGTLVGVQDTDGVTRGLGVVERADGETLTIVTHVARTTAATVLVGETTLEG